MATMLSAKVESIIKEEKMPTVEVQNNDYAAMEYLAKMNF